GGAGDGAAADAAVVGDGVALAPGEAARDVEAPRPVGSDLIHAVDAVRPLAVDVDVAEGARAGARALQHDLAVARVGEVPGDVDDLAVGNVPRPVVPGEVAAHHPPVGEALVEGDRGALVVLLDVAVVEEGAVAS